MKLNANLIPHKDFHKGYWLKTNQCPWFFFYESPREFKIPNNKEFYKTLDEDLKESVIHLHSLGIPTTPSCSGHVKDDRHYDEIYNTLENTQNRIKESGVDLINPETNKKFFYQNPKYNLPMEREDFVNKIRKYQKRGVLGFVDDGEIYEMLNYELPLERSGDVTMILTEGKTKGQIKRNWKNIEKIIKELCKN